MMMDVFIITVSDFYKKKFGTLSQLMLMTLFTMNLVHFGDLVGPLMCPTANRLKTFGRF